MRIHDIRSELWLPRPVEDVFAFFGDAANLEPLTPAWLHFRVLTPQPFEMREGTLIDYRLRVRGFPIRWQSEITTWEPPRRFVDESRRGPYRLWIHEHTFEPRDGGTLVRDRVDYAHWGGALIERFLVAPDLRRIFEFRRDRMREFLGVGPMDPQGRPSAAAPA